MWFPLHLKQRNICGILLLSIAQEHHLNLYWSIRPKIEGAKSWTANNNSLLLFPQNAETVKQICPYWSLYKQTRSGCTLVLLIIYSMKHLAQTQDFSHQSFVYAFSPICSTTWRLLCCWAVRRKGMWQGFLRKDKSTLSFGESPVIWRRVSEGWGEEG